VARLKRPILILSPGRSGSSMVAGLFAKHGAWCGDCRPGDRHNPAGYFENDAIKMAMIDVAGRDFTGPDIEPQAGWPERVETIVRKQGYTTGPWIFKTGALYWPLWEVMKPLVIRVRRPILDIYESYKRCKFLPSKKYSDDDVGYIIARQVNIMNALEGPEVHSAPLVTGDHWEIKKALTTAGLPYDETVTKRFINSRLFTT